MTRMLEIIALAAFNIFKAADLIFGAVFDDRRSCRGWDADMM